MHLIVSGKFTAINLPGFGLTLVSRSWLLVSQLNFSVAVSPQDSLSPSSSFPQDGKTPNEKLTCVIIIGTFYGLLNLSLTPRRYCAGTL
jgi:hypothetical protein